MKNNYEKPNIQIIIFDEDIVLDASGNSGNNTGFHEGEPDMGDDN